MHGNNSYLCNFVGITATIKLNQIDINEIAIIEHDITAVINLISKEVTISKKSHDIVLDNLCESYAWWGRAYAFT